MRTWVLILPVVFFVSTRAASAGTIHVDQTNPSCPGIGSPTNPFCSIQSAIAVAVNGDTVLVQPGTYGENLDFLGKSITLESASGASVTIIDPTNPLSTIRVVGASAGATIRGFTIRPAVQGSPVTLPFPYGSTDAGGAIYSENSVLTLSEDVIEPAVGGSGFARVGGGVCGYGGKVTMTDTIVRGRISADWGGGVFFRDLLSSKLLRVEIDVDDAQIGAGAYVANCPSLEVLDCSFHDNGTVFFGFLSGSGAGLYVDSSPNTLIRGSSFLNNACDNGGGGLVIAQCSAKVEDCRFHDNTTTFEGGGVAVYDSFEVTLSRCDFSGNFSTQGGGLYFVSFASGSMTVEDCVFVSNAASVGEGVAALGGSHTFRRSSFLLHSSVGPFGYALLSNGTNTLTEDCLIASNRFGINVSGQVLRSTIADNSEVGMSLDVGKTATITSCIFAGNGAQPGFQIDDLGGGATVSDSLVEGGFPGVNVISADPKFVNAAGLDYRLQATSPCIDAGSSSDNVCGVDAAGSPRRVSKNFVPPARVDMGAFEFRHIELSATPTGPLAWQLHTSGTSGLATLMFVGLPSGSTCVGGVGTLLFDLTQPFAILSFGAIPTTAPLAISSFPGLPPEILFQAIALGPSGGGNLSNAVILSTQ